MPQAGSPSWHLAGYMVATGDRTYVQSDAASRAAASLTHEPDAVYTPGWFEVEYLVPSKIVKTRFRRIAPSVETGPSTCGVGRADSAHRADVHKLVRPAF